MTPLKFLAEKRQGEHDKNKFAERQSRSMRAAVFPNFQKDNALEYAREVCDRLHRNGIEVWIDKSYETEFQDKAAVRFGCFDEFVKDADLAVAIGGDGTILKCAGHITDCKAKLLGINTGRLGFMSAIESDELEYLDRLKTGDYNVTQRMMLECRIPCSNKVYRALNDITISGMYTGICDFNIYDEKGAIGEYRADGVIFSTPTGSTAYSLSAGGPIIDPDMDCIEMTLICPHSLYARPMVFPPEKQIRFRTSDKNRQSVFVSVDGNENMTVSNGEIVDIRRSDQKINLIHMNDNTFYNALNRKIMHSIK